MAEVQDGTIEEEWQQPDVFPMYDAHKRFDR